MKVGLSIEKEQPEDLQQGGYAQKDHNLKQIDGFLYEQNLLDSNDFRQSPFFSSCCNNYLFVFEDG